MLVALLRRLLGALSAFGVIPVATHHPPALGECPVCGAFDRQLVLRTAWDVYYLLL